MRAWHLPVTQTWAERYRMRDIWASSLIPLSPPSLPVQAKGNPESTFNDENLRLVVSELFAAGMVTTSITLSWALLLMILHPDVQREPGWEWMGGQGKEVVTRFPNLFGKSLVQTRGLVQASTGMTLA